jgi:hypothetical protein
MNTKEDLGVGSEQREPASISSASRSDDGSFVLAPCPFCGGSCEVEEMTDDTQLYGCAACDVWRLSAVQWNSRAWKPTVIAWGVMSDDSVVMVRFDSEAEAEGYAQRKGREVHRLISPIDYARVCGTLPLLPESKPASGDASAAVENSPSVATEPNKQGAKS